MARAVVFIGPMGSGKSSIGRRVAKRLGATFTDTDSLVVAEHGPIADLFTERGEAEFRRIEAETVASALERGGVVALGGGAVLAYETQEALRRHHVILLTIGDGAIRSRIRGSKRPLLNGGDAVAEWKRIAEERRPIYTSLADVTYDTSSGPVKRVVERAAEWARRKLREDENPDD